MAGSFVAVLIWLQVKHFVADYLLQPAWVLNGKGNVLKPGGYVHAGAHAMGSLPAFFYAGLDIGWAGSLFAMEFVIHYLIDHVKAVWSHYRPLSTTTRAFWALHGADQMLHHLTYAGLMLGMFSGRG